MRAFLTGATGCLGHCLLVELINQGWEVIVAHRPTSDLSRLSHLNGKFQTFELKKEIKLPLGIDAVFHVAGNTSHYNPNKKALDIQYADNVLLTEKLAQAALENNVKRFIHISTGATRFYRFGDVKMAQSIKNSYIRTKRLAELKLYEAMKKGLDIVILSPFVLIGPYDYVNYSQIFTGIANQSLHLALPAEIDFSDTEETAKACINAFHKGKSFENYLLGGHHKTWISLYEMIAAELNVPLKASPAPLPLVKVKALIDESWARISGKKPEVTFDLVRMLGYEPEIPYQERLKSEKEIDYFIPPLEQSVKSCANWMKSVGLIK